LAQEHLETTDEVPLECHFQAYADSAAALERWYAGGKAGPRPPGRLRPLADVHQGRFTRAWATAAYRLLFDPDGRPLGLRLKRSM
jgi:hypothetical protein